MSADAFLAGLDFGDEIEHIWPRRPTRNRSFTRKNKRGDVPQPGQRYDFKLHRIAIGTTQGYQFNTGGIIDLDPAFSKLGLAFNPGSKTIKFELVPPDPDAVGFKYFPEWIEGIINLDDILNRGLALSASRSDASGYEATMTISLRRPPVLRVNYGGCPKRDGRALTDQSRRTTEMDWSISGAVEGNSGCLDPLPVEGVRPNLFINFGQWLSYQFTFPIRNRDLDSLKNTLNNIRTSDKTEIYRPGHQRESLDSPKERITLMPTSADEQATISRIQNMSGVSFDVKYLIIGLITRGIVLLQEFSQFWRLLKIHSPDKQIWILRALYREERITNFYKTLATLSRLYGEKKGPPSAYSVPIRKIFVTPTRVIPCPPEMEVSNRVLRQFKEHIDRFIRVQFTEEDGTKLFVDDRIKKVHDLNPSEGILSRVRTALREGVRVAGRLYTFVAYSDGMAKMGQAWYVAEEGDFTADNIRKWMGDFSSEKIIAKHASRLGLCFSSTRAVGDIEFEMIPDIKHGKHTYTDGVGLMSPELAKRCAQALGLTDVVPSAVQIRFAGFKGMLTISDKAVGNRVLARPSMQKFSATHKTLGVCQVATYGRGYLSRQSILLMEALGVPEKEFENLFAVQVARARLLSNAQRSPDVFREMRKKRAYKLSSFPIHRLLAEGFHNETLLRNVLKVLECRVLHDLKYRARMEVDKAAFLMGIADEFGVLAEDQVFCSIVDPDSDQTEPRVVKGPCTIFRSPALHPGDVRRVTAIDHPLLRHLVNVIVFPTTAGKRDLPSMLGGGDLDGDTFTIIWEPAFVVPQSYEAMDYTAPISPKVDNVTIPDVQAFFVEFMMHDKLGKISSDHMAVADKHGPFSCGAIQLARLASTAADFAKTGVPAVYTDAKPMIPDFMESHVREKTYKSNRVLGRMFRLIDPAPEFEPLTDVYLDPRLKWMGRIVPDKFYRKAGMVKRRYDVDLGGIMRRYSMAEAEVVGGMCTTPAEKRKRRERDDSLRGPVKEAFDDLARLYRAEVEAYCEENPAPLINAHQAFAVAAYMCANCETHRKRFVECAAEDDNVSTSSFGGGDDYALEEGERMETNMLSFPFLFVQHLLDAVNNPQLGGGAVAGASIAGTSTTSLASAKTAAIAATAAGIKPIAA